MRINASALYQHLLADLANVIDVQLPSWAPDSDPQSVACYALRDSLLKKFNNEDKPSQAASDAALKKFMAVNRRCGEWVIPYEFSQDEMLVGGFKVAIENFWYGHDGLSPVISDYRTVFERGRTGPGSSIGARDTDLYTKMFDSSLSCTARCLDIWQRCTPKGLWAEAEAFRSTFHGYTVTEVNHLSFVNKTTTIARNICTEPSLNMWLQLGVGDMISERLHSHFGIDIREQPDVNRALARRGSITGGLATIDLESASDSISYKVMKGLLPRSMFGILDALRTRSTKLPDGSVVELNMISTMGNGFTFPLQTAIFCSVVKSVYNYLGYPMYKRGVGGCRNFSVFGDDIIVSSGAARLVLRLLYLLGFIVNTDKTFVEGRFRESCGADFVDGINVRGVYIKSLKTTQDLFVAINTLNRWSAKTDVQLARTVAYLCSGIPSPHKRLVPPDEDDAAGIHVPQSYADAHVYVRTRAGSVRYTATVPRVWDMIIAGKYVWTFKGQVDRSYNPSGLYVAFLSGNIRGYRIALRQKVVRYTSRRKFTPSWDYLPPRPHELPLGSSWGRRFVDACDRNFVSCGFGVWA